MPDTEKRPYVCECGHQLNDHRDHPDPLNINEPCRKCGCRNFVRAPRIGDQLRKHITAAQHDLDLAMRAVEDAPSHVARNQRVQETYNIVIAANDRLQEAMEAVGPDPDDEADLLGFQ